MNATATAKNIRIAPRKVRLVVNSIRGKNVVRAIAHLNTLRNSAVVPVLKVLQSAISNADTKDSTADVDKYRIVKAYVNEARKLKRFRPRAMGRASGIKKRSSHITLEIGE